MLSSTPWCCGTATGEIINNISFANTNALPNFNPQEIVTGEHSGLGTYFGILAGRPDTNQNVVTAFNNTGIRWVGDDNSAKPNQRALGNVLTIPRYPSNVYYNVAARDDQVDEYNYIYLPPTYAPQPGVCVNTGVTTCRSAPALWPEYSNTEANIMFGHVMSGEAALRAPVQPHPRWERADHSLQAVRRRRRSRRATMSSSTSTRRTSTRTRRSSSPPSPSPANCSRRRPSGTRRSRRGVPRATSSTGWCIP